MSMLDFAVMATAEYIDHMPKSQRKKYGQFFTSKETAIFMAGLFETLSLTIVATNELHDFNHVLGCNYEKDLHL